MTFTSPTQRRRGRSLPLLMALLSISACIRSNDPPRPATTPAAAKPVTSSIDGKTLFLENCATCHLGGGGLLGAPRTPDLFEESLARGETEAALLQAIRYGIDPPRMPAFEKGLSEDEMRMITIYVLERRQSVQARN